jgi:hypothetical protein
MSGRTLTKVGKTAIALPAAPSKTGWKKKL